MNQHGIRLSTRILAGAIAIVVTGFLALVFIEESRLRESYQNDLGSALEKSLKVEDVRLSQAITNMRKDVLFLSNTPPVSGIVRAALNHGYDARGRDTRVRWEARLQQIFSAYSTANPGYYQIRYIGVADGGREIVRVDNRSGKVEITPSARLQRKGDRDYFKATLALHPGEVHVSELNLNREWGLIEQPHRPTLRAATPVFKPNGEIFGMVVINLDVSRLLASSTSGLPAGVQAYISNMYGEYLYHPDAQRAFGFELGRKDNIAADFPSLETVFNQGSSEHVPLQAVRAKAGTQYLAAQRIHFDPGNPARFLLLAYHIPDAVVTKQITLIPPAHIAGGFAAMLLVGAIVLLALRRTFAPLEQIADAADKIAAGNHNVMLPKAGSGEIGRLANALGIMLDKLLQREKDILQSNTELEGRVSERTRELENINELLQGEVLRGKKLQQETETLLSRNQALMQTSMDGIHVMDMHGNIVMANDAFCRMLGYSREEAARLNVADWDVRWPAEELRARFKSLAGKSFLFETVHRRKDGTLIDVEISTSGMEIEEQYFLFAASRDITARKQAEEALRVAAAAFETQDAIMITDAAGNIVRVNQAFSAVTGYSPEEVLGKNPRMMNSGRHDQAFFAAMWQQLLHTGAWCGEIWDRHKTGRIYLKWVTITAVKNEQQATIRYVAIFSDITARKRIEEEKLRESEERFRGTLEQAAVGIAHATLDGYFKQTNQKFCNIVGYTRDELAHMSFYDITCHADLDENGRYIQKLVAGEISTFSMEKRYVRKDGNLVWVNVTASLLRDIDDGTPKYTIGVIEDITERKRAEAKAQRFGRLLQSSFNEIYLFDASSLHFLQVSEGAKINLGYSIEELKQLAPPDLMSSFTWGNFESMVAPLRRGEQQLLHYETLQRRKNGTIYPVEVYMQYIDTDTDADSDSAAGAFLAVIQDTTERKRAVEALNKSEMKYRTLVESSRDAILTATADDGVLSGNPAAVALFGCRDEQELIALSTAALSPEFQPDGRRSDVAIREMMGLAMEKGSYFFEWTHMRVDGAEFIADVLLTCMDIDGKKIIHGVVRDITGRKRVEQQLRDLSAHIQAAREEEKARVAREIHDDLGGTLTALKMDAFWLARDLNAGKETELLLERIGSMSGLLDNAVAVARRIITDLRPTMLDELGLVAALEWQAAQFSKRTGIECLVACTGEPGCEGVPDKAQSINLFRIFQEALTNVARHSGASRVEVQIMHDDEGITLTVSDNGSGLPCGHTVASSSYGIRGMCERAGQLGGKIIFDKPPGGGLSLIVKLPQPADKEEKSCSVS